MTDVFPGATLRQLVEWGYPRGSVRPVPPADKAFSVIHITGNSRLPSAENEVAWRINDTALQNSATFFVNRDGSIVQALGDPLHMDPWANGDVNRPDLSNPRIAAVVRDGVNANQRTLVAIENVGYEPGFPITAAQEQACAAIVAHYHARAGVPVSRETVIGHYQLNSVSRLNCPSSSDKAVVDRIVAAATRKLPDTAIEEDAMPKLIRAITGQKAAIRAGITVRRGRPSFGAPGFTIPASTVQPVAVVEGDAYRTASGTSSEWIEYIGNDPERRYFPAPYAVLSPINEAGLKLERIADAAKGARRAITAVINIAEE